MTVECVRNMYFFIFIGWLNTRTSMIKTNVLFDVTFRYALLALNKLKQLKQEADDWAAKGNVFFCFSVFLILKDF